MNPAVLLGAVLALIAFSYFFGRRKAYAVAGGPTRPVKLHSLPSYYGSLTALWCGLPALAVLGLWLAFESTVVTQLVVSALPEETQSLPEGRLGLIVNDIKNIVAGNVVSANVDASLKAAADHYRHLQNISKAALAVIVLAIAIGGLTYGTRLIRPDLRARNHVESTVQWLLILCSTVAIFTTVGIVLSVLFESLRFFDKVPLPTSCSAFSGVRKPPYAKTRWALPARSVRCRCLRARCSYPPLPCWSRRPSGLLSAIYLAEYANPGTRCRQTPARDPRRDTDRRLRLLRRLTVAPEVRGIGEWLGLDVASESALAAGWSWG